MTPWQYTPMTPWQYTLAAMGKREHDPCSKEEFITAGAIEKSITDAIAAERERCARIAESHIPGDTSSIAQQIAAGIRVQA